MYGGGGGGGGGSACMRVCVCAIFECVVHADSAFPSVNSKTLLALQERGLYFMGMVKTAHKEYPLAYLQSWGKGQEDEAVPARGDFCLLETQAENGIPFDALGWADKKMKTIVSNVGSTLSGTPCKRKRHKKEEVNGVLETVVYFKQVKRPAMIIEEFFSCFGIIDRHDHYRQGSLELEREWCIHTSGGIVYLPQFLRCVLLIRSWLTHLKCKVHMGHQMIS